MYSLPWGDNRPSSGKWWQMTKPLRILIADGHRLFRQGLRRLLDSAPDGILVIGEAADGPEAVRLVPELKPDILVMDLALPKLDGFEVLRSTEDVAKVILTAKISEQEANRAMQLGVRGILLKQCPVTDLIQCIRHIGAGGTCIGKDNPRSVGTATKPKSSMERSGNTRLRLTKRELEIIEAVVEGGTNQQIVTQLRLSVQTVKHHLTNIFNKTGSSNRLELVLYAIEKKLVDNSQRRIETTAVAAAARRRQPV